MWREAPVVLFELLSERVPVETEQSYENLPGQTG
jgi:hypothetical protein